MLYQSFARYTVARDDIDDARGKAYFVRNFREGQRSEGRKFRGFQHHRVAGRQRRRDFPRQHQQREIPGNDLSDHAAGGVIPELLLDKLCPTRVMVEMAGYQRNIQIAAFTDGFAVVESLEYGEPARMLLHLASQRIEKARTLVSGQFLPAAQGGTRGLHGGFDVGGASLGYIGDFFAGRGIAGFEISSLNRCLELPVDEMAEAALVALEPEQGLFRVLGRRSVLH